MTADIVNALYELLGSAFVMLSVLKTYQNKSSKGISWLTCGFFASWGYWNLYYYPTLDQWWSFGGAIVLAVANTLWLALLVRYNGK